MRRYKLSNPTAAVPGEILQVLAELSQCARLAAMLTAPGTLAYARDYKHAALVNRALGLSQRRIDEYLRAVATKRPEPPRNGRAAEN